ncbi:hypothetical protein EV360DRAFT_35428 [Lentinula raphanica]|nr:hypothetical protein EV360DRAFT_35428 [Lentinula raphanica]
MGAFVDHPLTLTSLHQKGIPVWFVRKVEATPDARIDRRVGVIAEDRLLCFQLPSGFKVDGIDSEPPHRVIWEGLPDKTERYAAMSKYLQSLLYHPAFFGSELGRASTSDMSSIKRVEEIPVLSEPLSTKKLNPKTMSQPCK